MLYPGGTKVREVYAGSTFIDRIYKGNQLVYKYSPNLPPEYDTTTVASSSGGGVISSTSYTVPRTGWYRVHAYNHYDDYRRNCYFNVDGVRQFTWSDRFSDKYYGPYLYQKGQVLTIGWTYNYTVFIELQQCY